MSVSQIETDSAADPQSDPPGDEARHSIRSRTIRGAIVTVLGYGGTQIIRFGSNLVLTYLLFEEAFGVMALIQSLIIGLHLFSDIGVGPSIIQHRRGDDERFLNTAWTIQLVRGFVLWGIALALAAPASAFFRDPGGPDLFWFMIVASLMAPIEGFTSTSVYTLNRHLAMVRYTMIEIGLQLVTVLVTIVWALISPTVWALVGGCLAGGLFRVLMTHWMNHFRHRLTFDREAFRDLIKFGRWILLSTLLVFVADHAQPIILKTLTKFDELGVYNLAMQMALLAPMVITRITSQVFFPAFSRLIENKVDFRAPFRAWRRILYLVGGYLIAGMMATGVPVIDFLYLPRWIEAGWMLQLVAIGMWFSIMEAPSESALLAMGHSKWMALGNLSKVIGIAVLVPIGFHYLAFPGAVLGLALSNAVKYLTVAVAARSHDLPVLRHDFLFSVWVAITGGGIYYLCEYLASGRFPDEPGPGLNAMSVSAIGIAAVTLLWAPVALFIYRDRKRLQKLLRANAEADTDADPAPA